MRAGDARVSLRDEPGGRYDVVVGDAFGGRAVPWHLTTREFLEEVRRVLRPGGTYVVNVIDEPPLAFARAEARTLGLTFDRVAALVTPAEAAGRAGGNVILVASDRPLPLRPAGAPGGARGGRGRAGGRCAGPLRRGRARADRRLRAG